MRRRRRSRHWPSAPPSNCGRKGLPVISVISLRESVMRRCSWRREGLEIMQRIVKPLVNGRVLAFLAILGAAFANLLFGLSYWLASSDLGRGPGSPGILGRALLLALAVFGVLLASCGTWGAWFFLRLERRRQVASHGSGALTFLATEQPSPRAGSLVLPVIIGIRAMWALKLIAWPWIALLMIASASEGLDHGVWDVRFFLGLLVALGTGSVFASLLMGERQIEVTDDQIMVRAGLDEQTVPWEEARLFAITRGRYATVSYELASAQASIPWVWVRPGAFGARLFEPTIPQYEYDRQMEALLALVAAKTGLPLCDLR